jgi:hypothetical protein
MDRGLDMTGAVANRLGLTATGLESLAPRAILAWLERVRAGGLNDVESRATLLLVYRVWLIALFLKALGSGWDVAWHFKFNRDDFAPPHNINLLGDGIAIVLVLLHWYTRFGVDRVALWLMAVGATLFVGSAPVDVINHRLNGLDITSWSVTHFGLYTGTAILIAGVIRGWRQHSTGVPGRTFILLGLWFFFVENVWFPAQHQEYGVEEIASWDRGEPYAEPSLLEFAASQIGRPVDRESVVHFSLPVEAWVYPLWIVTAVGLTLVVARRSVGHRWTATILAGAFLAWRCVLWPLLVGIDFPTSAVPFLILGLGLAVDVAVQLRLPWIAEAAVGSVLAGTAVYLGAFVQSYVLVAPPISYWSAPVATAILFAAWCVVRILPILIARRGTAGRAEWSAVLRTR